MGVKIVKIEPHLLKSKISNDFLEKFYSVANSSIFGDSTTATFIKKSEKDRFSISSLELKGLYTIISLL